MSEEGVIELDLEPNSHSYRQFDFPDTGLVRVNVAASEPINVHIVPTAQVANFEANLAFDYYYSRRAQLAVDTGKIKLEIIGPSYCVIMANPKSTRVAVRCAVYEYEWMRIPL